MAGGFRGGVDSNWSARHHSRGIPTGPKASIPLAEMCLNDVDHYLIGRGYTHVRYVDDFRVFCETRERARRAIHDLSEYLFKSHRLTLQAGKTEIVDVASFVASRLEDPKIVHRAREKEKIAELLELARAMSEYGVAEEDLDEEDKVQAAHEAVSELLEGCLRADRLNLGLARYLLRRASRLRTNRIQTLVINNLEVLIPALRETMLYLEAARQKKTAKRVARAILALAEQSEVAFLRFVREWCLSALSGRFLEEAADDAIRLADASQGMLGLRPRAILAERKRQLHWVREYKETWRNAGPWDRRAIILAGGALPENERRHWREVILASEDPLDRAVGRFAL